MVMCDVMCDGYACCHVGVRGYWVVLCYAVLAAAHGATQLMFWLVLGVCAWPAAPAVLGDGVPDRPLNNSIYLLVGRLHLPAQESVWQESPTILSQTWEGQAAVGSESSEGMVMSYQAMARPVLTDRSW